MLLTGIDTSIIIQLLTKLLLQSTLLVKALQHSLKQHIATSLSHPRLIKREDIWGLYNLSIENKVAGCSLLLYPTMLLVAAIILNMGRTLMAN